MAQYGNDDRTGIEPIPETDVGRVPLVGHLRAFGEKSEVRVALAAGLLCLLAGVAMLTRSSSSSAGDGSIAAIEAGPPSSAGVRTPRTVTVHAAGAVRRPGVYKVEAGTRIAELVETAGGFADGADTNVVNLAAEVVDGAQVYFPLLGEQALASGGGAGESRGALLNLNTATAAQLEELPGVGPSTAQAILDFRKEAGGFKSVDDLLEVRGIGDTKFASLRSKVTV